MSQLKTILKFNWVRDLLFASIVYTLMVSFSIVRMPLCSFLGAHSCSVVNASAFQIVFYLSYFFSLYVLYLFVKFIVYIIYSIYRGIHAMGEKKSETKTVAIKVAPSAIKAKKPVAKTTKKSKTSKK